MSCVRIHLLMPQDILFFYFVVIFSIVKDSESLIKTHRFLKPHIISIIQDDLGWWDSGINNPTVARWTQNLTELAEQGIVLQWHYTHYHCSPSRRAFMTGRLPIFQSEHLSDYDDDHIDLRMAWVSDKLAAAGYTSYWFGKMHTGFKSMAHLPYKHGFSNYSFGSLKTGGPYVGRHHDARWYGNVSVWNDSQFIDAPIEYGCPVDNKRAHGVCANDYADALYGQLALQALRNHNLSQGPLFLHLCFQAVHEPCKILPPEFPECDHNKSTAKAALACFDKLGRNREHSTAKTRRVYRGLLWYSDVIVGKLINMLKARRMYDNTLIVYFSDNGGAHKFGNNYPLRGTKHTNWDGAMRTPAFVSGGIIPKHLRGTINNHTIHVVDWYATFAALAGVDPSDNAPVRPLRFDVNQPWKNIYGNESFPDVDGVNVWPLLMNPQLFTSISEAHPKGLILSREAIIYGPWKLIVAQPHNIVSLDGHQGWSTQRGFWKHAKDELPCMLRSNSPSHSLLPVPVHYHDKGQVPCLFNVREDPREEHEVSSLFPDIVTLLWTTLNESVARSRDCSGSSYQGTPGHIPGPLQTDGTRGCSPPHLLGPCHTECARSLWAARKIDTTRKMQVSRAEGPICGVPWCDGSGQPN